MRFPMSKEIVFDSPLAREVWLEGIRKQCAKTTFMPPNFIVKDDEVFLYQPTLTGAAMQSAFFGSVEKSAAGSRIRGRFRMLLGWSILTGGAACVMIFMSFIIGWGQLSDLRSGARPWDAGDATIDALMPLIAGLSVFAFWKFGKWADGSNRKNVSELIEAGAKGA